MRIFVILVLVSTFLQTAAATAASVSSQYTVLDWADCKKLEIFEQNMGGSVLCPGLGKRMLYVAEGDLRFFIAYGPDAKTQRAASQTLSAFNTIFRTNENRTTIEWRVVKQGVKWQPFATIIRYYTDDNGQKGQTLVVSKLSGNENCHVAYINARRRDANKLARRIADRHARSFDCRKDPLQY